jgi:hypothetical protein
MRCSLPFSATIHLFHALGCSCAPTMRISPDEDQPALEGSALLEPDQPFVEVQSSLVIFFCEN